MYVCLHPYRDQKDVGIKKTFFSKRNGHETSRGDTRRIFCFRNTATNKSRPFYWSHKSLE